MTLARPYRAFLLAPFGGERRLLSRAESRLPASPPLYSGAHPVSTASGRSPRRRVCLAFLPEASERRRRLLATLDRLAAGETMLVVDHNAPRRWVVRVVAAAYLALGWPLVRSPFTRLYHPVARELQELGLDVLALRLLCGELFQAVLVRRR